MTEINEETKQRFEEALNKNKKEREEKENKRKGGGGSFYSVEWAFLEDQKEVVGRIVGNPIEFRDKPTDPKMFYVSQFVNDKAEAYINVFWKMKNNKEIDEDWILYRLYDTAYKKEWKKFPDGQKNEKGHDGEYVFKHVNTDTFKRLEANKKKSASPNSFPPKVKPRARVGFNWIHKMDSWCKDNNKTKVLSSKQNYWKDDENGNPINFPEWGVPETLYNKIMDDIVGFRFHWNLDLVIKKNSKDINNAYIVKDIKEEKITDHSKEVGTDADLTSEELAYELWDLDKAFRVTLYKKLKDNLSGLFKLADTEFGTNFYDELVKLEAEEAVVREAEQKEKAEETQKAFEEEIEKEFSEVHNKSELDKQFEKEIEKDDASDEKKERRRTSIDFSSHFPSWDKVPESERKTFQNTIEKFDGNVPVYKSGLSLLGCADSNCKFKDSDTPTVFPDDIFTCPVCGKVDEQE
ncbi:MAG: hypothetical protein ACFFDN_40825 [Candidatus Hodarchaeota archaeon]